MIAGVLLAAGASSRMGRDKALLRRGGDSYLVRGVRRPQAACDRVVVVLGAHHAAIRGGVEVEFAALVHRRALDRDFHARPGTSRAKRRIEVHFVVNPGWRSGMLSSVRAGLRDALSMEPEAVIVLPVDHPDVRPATIANLGHLMHAARQHTPARARRALLQALVPRHRGRRGHPVALTAALALRIADDAGAADLSDAIRRHAALVGYVDVADPGVLRNRNHPGD